MTFFIYTVWHLSMCAIIFLWSIINVLEKRGKENENAINNMCAIGFMMTGPIVVASNYCNSSTSVRTNCETYSGYYGYMTNGNKEKKKYCEGKCYRANCTPVTPGGTWYDSTGTKNSCN